MTESEVLAWIANLFEESPDNIAPETARESIEAWDSLGTLSLIAGLEEKFEILVSEDELRQLRRVGDILELIRKAGKLA